MVNLAVDASVLSSLSELRTVLSIILSTIFSTLDSPPNRLASCTNIERCQNPAQAIWVELPGRKAFGRFDQMVRRDFTPAFAALATRRCGCCGPGPSPRRSICLGAPEAEMTAAQTATSAPAGARFPLRSRHGRKDLAWLPIDRAVLWCPRDICAQGR